MRSVLPAVSGLLAEEALERLQGITIAQQCPAAVRLDLDGADVVGAAKDEAVVAGFG